ncbi:MAG TPA: tetratricopeptide repeat protein [Puia sp.]|nr:tetratricopeptide repeat protein [Puia sp.]
MATFDKEWIVRYVEDGLSPEERRQFELRLEEDPGLRSQVALYREVRSVLEKRLPADQNEQSLRVSLQQLNAEHFSPAGQTAKGPRRISLTRWAAGMAAAAAIIVATMLLWPSSRDSVFDRLGRTEMISTTERGNNSDSLIREAAAHFNKQDFAGALPFLDRAVRADSTNQLALFYQGVAEWHIGRGDEARRVLQHVFNGESVLRYEAAFYLALSYARENKKDSAREWLKKIPADAPVSSRASELEINLK